MEKGLEEVLALPRRLDLHRTQSLHSLYQGRKLLLERERRHGNPKALDDFHVQALHDRALGRHAELVADVGMMEKRTVEIDWQAAFLVERDAAKMLGVNGGRDVVGDDQAVET